MPCVGKRGRERDRQADMPCVGKRGREREIGRLTCHV